MTLNSDKKTDHTPVKGINGDTRSAPPPAHSVLDSVCRSATELAKAVPKPPQRIRLQYGQTSVEVEWPPEPAEPAPQPAAQPPAQPGAQHSVQPGTQPAAQPGAQQAHSAQEAQNSRSTHYLCAPTVGTFYRSPEPGAPPFVAVGDVVRPGQPVGVLEVMKMMSTVEADAAGRVVEFLVPDAHSVEYQQRLLALEPVEEG
ncbi:acetyl-CoA carboxylase biotin carboxyl carrier protein [Streptomyces sp. NPDC059373]